MTALNYIKISKWLQIQLSLERNCRINPKDLFDIITNDLQNIRDAEPIIPKTVISDFNTQYKNEETAKPAITNGLTKVKINKNLLADNTPKNDIIIVPTEEKPKEVKKPIFKV
jgi:hypothetical protein